MTYNVEWDAKHHYVQQSCNKMINSNCSTKVPKWLHYWPQCKISHPAWMGHLSRSDCFLWCNTRNFLAWSSSLGFLQHSGNAHQLCICSCKLLFRESQEVTGVSLDCPCTARGEGGVKFKVLLPSFFSEYTCQVSWTSAKRSWSVWVLNMLTQHGLNRHLTSFTKNWWKRQK